MTSSRADYSKQCEFLDDPQTGWSVGTFGAIAEFNRYTEESVSITHDGDFSLAITDLGALQIKHHPKARILPYECLSKLDNAWSQGVVINLPMAAARMSNNCVITDMGDDSEVLLTNSAGRLFDLGLGIPHIEACIRTDDQSLIKVLETYAETPLFGEDKTILAALHEASPARIFRSKLGRIEVYQAIPSSASNDVTPHGPHTHLMPELLAHNRTHAANIPVPEGWVPCFAFYPPNPIRNGDGDIMPFDRDAFDRFQNLIQRHSAPEISKIKRDTLDALAAGKSPQLQPVPSSRAERTALRIALRQFYHLRGPSDILSQWKSLYEPTGRQ